MAKHKKHWLPFAEWLNSLGTEDAAILVDEACYKRGVTLLELQSSRKTARIVLARTACCHVLRDKGYSFPKIGRILQCHHATVINAVRRPRQEALVQEG